MTELEKISLIAAYLEIASPSKQNAVLDYAQTNIDLWYQLQPTHIEQLQSILGDKAFTRLRYCLNDTFVQRIQDELYAKQVKFTTKYSSDYPKMLLDLSDPPTALFYKGNLKAVDKCCIAVVGTRKMTSYGKRVTQYFTQGLASEFCIVSGLAYGVDSVAHETALNCNGLTVAVLGNGFDHIYPSSNTALAQRIIDNNGLLLSEFAPSTMPSQYRFPMRNRIVAGLCRGVLITQAGQKSGTFSTLEYALETGREVYAVPGEIFSPDYAGSNDILKRIQGAMVTSPKDILDFFHIKYQNTEKVKIQLDLIEQSVVNLLSQGKQHFDRLVELSGLSAGELNYILTTLELKNVVMKLPGNFYQYIEE